MAGNLFPINLHSTFLQKVINFPQDVYNFNDGDNLTTLMKILLGNSGTGQLSNLQLVARLSQQQIEFSNLDNILGIILDIKRNSSEIYSFSTNPFIDQLLQTQWQEIITKDASYRERLLGAAEAFQIGCTLWGVLTLCEAMTQMDFYVVESWRTPEYGRAVNKQQEIVLVPLIDNSNFFTWDQSKAYSILQSIQKIFFFDLQISFGTPVVAFTAYSGSNVTVTASGVTTAPSGYSNYFYLQPTINSAQISTPATITPGASTRYWVQNNANTQAPWFAHLQTQETSIDLSGNIISATSSDNTANVNQSIANPLLEVTSTMYGAQ
jgi:hypothetical protein